MAAVSANKLELLQIADAVAREKSIDRTIVIAAMEDAIAKAYAGGKGSIVMQAKAHVEEMSRSKNRIVITELPYQTNKSNLIERIAELVREKRISLTQLKAAQDEQKRTGQNLTYALAKLGYISEKEIANFLAQEYRVPSIDLNAVELDPALGKIVSMARASSFMGNPPFARA